MIPSRWGCQLLIPRRRSRARGEILRGAVENPRGSRDDSRRISRPGNRDTRDGLVLHRTDVAGRCKGAATSRVSAQIEATGGYREANVSPNQTLFGGRDDCLKGMRTQNPRLAALLRRTLKGSPPPRLHLRDAPASRPAKPSHPPTTCNTSNWGIMTRMMEGLGCHDEAGGRGFGMKKRDKKHTFGIVHDKMLLSLTTRCKQIHTCFGLSGP